MSVLDNLAKVFENKADNSFPMKKDKPKKDGSASGDNSKKEDAKKAPPKPPAKAKGGTTAQAELAAYESNLPTSSSGIESVVICCDHRFETLPIESLEVFSKVSVISRDLNLHLHMNRLKTLEHKAQLHNNRGIDKE